MKVVKVKISELRNPERNVRKHNNTQIREFARSLEKFGQIRPVVIDENNVIHCGNGLVEAARSLGWERVEVLKKSGMSEADKKKLMIADNKIYQLGHDDYEVINEILASLDDFDVPGFDTETLESMFGDVEDELNSFGILSEEENETIDKARDANEKRASASSFPANEHNEFVVHDSQPESVPNWQTEQNVSGIEKRKVICPNCGGDVLVD